MKATAHSWPSAHRALSALLPTRRRALYIGLMVCAGLLVSGPGFAQPESSASPGPFELTDASGNTLRATLFAQLRSSARWDDGAVEPSLLGIRRLRPGLSASLMEERLDVEATWNLAPGSGQLVEALALIQAHPEHLSVSLGQFKTPWSRYRLSSGGDQVLVDWSRTTKYFGGERQLGISAQRSDHEGAGLYYAAGIFTGRNARRSHGVGLASVYGVSPQNPSSFGAEGEEPGVHPELIAHLGWASPGMDASRLDDPARSRFGIYLGAGVAVDFAPVATVEPGRRVSLEAMAKARGWSLYTGAYLAQSELVSGAPELPTTGALMGVLVESTYRVGRFSSVGARASRIMLSDALARDARLVRGESPATQLDELGLGARFDVMGEGVQVAADAGVERDKSPQRTTLAMLLRVQGQVSF